MIPAEFSIPVRLCDLWAGKEIRYLSVRSEMNVVSAAMAATPPMWTTTGLPRSRLEDRCSPHRLAQRYQAVLWRSPTAAEPMTAASDRTLTKDGVTATTAQALRRAMHRLLTGTARHTDGRLTKKNL